MQVTLTTTVKGLPALRGRLKDLTKRANALEDPIGVGLEVTDPYVEPVTYKDEKTGDFDTRPIELVSVDVILTNVPAEPDKVTGRVIRTLERLEAKDLRTVGAASCPTMYPNARVIDVIAAAVAEHGYITMEEYELIPETGVGISTQGYVWAALCENVDVEVRDPMVQGLRDEFIELASIDLDGYTSGKDVAVLVEQYGRYVRADLALRRATAAGESSRVGSPKQRSEMNLLLNTIRAERAAYGLLVTVEGVVCDEDGAPTPDRFVWYTGPDAVRPFISAGDDGRAVLPQGFVRVVATIRRYEDDAVGGCQTVLGAVRYPKVKVKPEAAKDEPAAEVEDTADTSE